MGVPASLFSILLIRLRGHIVFQKLPAGYVALYP